MPILDYLGKQQQAKQLGEIRIGYSTPGKRGPQPHKSDTFLFTTPLEYRAEELASLFDGKVQPVTLANNISTFMVKTNRKSLDVVKPPGEQAIDQWRELWKGSVCLKRCDGQTEQKSGRPCVDFCPSDPQERKDSADGCSDTTRLRLVLLDAPGIGVWQITTHSFHSSIGAAGVTSMLNDAEAQGIYLLCRLSTYEKKSNSKKFPVIDLSPLVTPRELIALSSGDPRISAVISAPAERMAALGAGKHEPTIDLAQWVVDSLGGEAQALLNQKWRETGWKFRFSAVPESLVDDVKALVISCQIHEEEDIADAEILEEHEDPMASVQSSIIRWQEIDQLRQAAGKIGPAWTNLARSVLKRNVSGDERNFSQEEMQKLKERLHAA